ncbi:MAG TPA: DUF72 domain-containing protein [Fimbriimonadaceae bacterium]|nr:DUF72 domain-containing protein [Fimbriimonadaceae bacterium]
MPRLWIGLSGYSYKPWQGEGRFYPPDIKQSGFLAYYAGRYPAVEMDGTWYRMPGEKAVQEWGANSPPGFRFSFKLHRQITHMARLKLESIDSLRFMLKRLGPLAAGGKLGPLLIQLPPNMKRNDERLSQFLENLPIEIEGVAPLSRPLEWAVEFRHESWNAKEVEEIMRRRRVAWVAADTDEAAAQRRDTGSCHYARLRRSEYSEDALADWGRYFAQTGKDCYVYCKHEDEGAPWIWADLLARQQIT